MSRRARIHYPGAVYHVMARGVDGRNIFTDDTDRLGFLRSVLSIQSDASFSVLAYCLMDNHFHFAVKVSSTPLSKIMHRLLTSYALRFNTRHERAGHLFQARYKALLCLNDAYLISLVRYIHQNPVRAGLVSSPNDWPWSSHRSYLERSVSSMTDTTFFLEAFGASGLDRSDYNNWAAHTTEDFNPWLEDESSPDLYRDDEIEVVPLEVLAASLFPDDTAELRSRCRRHPIVRKKFIFAEKAVRNGHSQTSIATWMGCSPSGIHRLLRRNKSQVKA